MVFLRPEPKVRLTYSCADVFIQLIQLNDQEVVCSSLLEVLQLLHVARRKRKHKREEQAAMGAAVGAGNS
jgi:hypothetical protein